MLCLKSGQLRGEATVSWSSPVQHANMLCPASKSSGLKKNLAGNALAHDCAPDEEAAHLLRGGGLLGGRPPEPGETTAGDAPEQRERQHDEGKDRDGNDGEADQAEDNFGGEVNAVAERLADARHET